MRIRGGGSTLGLPGHHSSVPMICGYLCQFARTAGLSIQKVVSDEAFVGESSSPRGSPAPISMGISGSGPGVMDRVCERLSGMVPKGGVHAEVFLFAGVFVVV
jgi:hypothetical protein